MTRPYAEVIGDPIAHSKSPLIHNFWLAKLGIDAEYRATQVRADELADYFARRRGDPDWRGCNVTMPHKLAARAHVDALGHGGKARDRGEPMNVAIPHRGGIEGSNSDTTGVFDPLFALVRAQPAPRGPAIVVGAGGLFPSARWALIVLSYDPLYVVMRDAGKLAAVPTHYGGRQTIPMLFGEPLPPANLLLNATPLGMTGFPDFPLSIDSLAPDAVVFETIYHPHETALLRDARARGLRTIDGLSMLVAQAAPAFLKFFGKPAPREHDAELRALLTA